MKSEPMGGACGGKVARALFRYQGGKQKLCSRIVDIFPAKMGRYLEPFIGAASVYLELRNRGFRGPAFLSDWNVEVANVHQVVAADPDSFEKAYHTHVERHSQDYFYSLRDQAVSDWSLMERAARIVYIAKAAFHGLLRVNTQGQIISTYGTGELSRVMLDENRIRAVSAAFQGADIRHADFGWIEQEAQEGDLVFLDPPYLGGNTAFTAGRFGEEDQRRLLRTCQALDAKGVRFIQTNSDRPITRDLYRGFRMTSVPPAPSIGRGGASRQPVGEVIIANYDPEVKAGVEFEVAA